MRFDPSPQGDKENEKMPFFLLQSGKKILNKEGRTQWNPLPGIVGPLLH